MTLTDTAGNSGTNDRGPHCYHKV